MNLFLDELENARFGVVCAKLQLAEDDAVDMKAIDSYCRDNNVDMLSTRVDVGDFDKIHALERAGFMLMDTLSYYQATLSKMTIPTFDIAAVEIRQSVPEDAAAVEALTAQTFKGYYGHYHMDPRLSDHDADMVYSDWAFKSIAYADEQSPCAVGIDDEGGLAAFLTTKNVGTETAEIVLGGIRPDLRMLGLYQEIMCYTLRMIESSGSQKVHISTQLNNYGVQKVWARMGYWMYKNIYTFHKWYS